MYFHLNHGLWFGFFISFLFCEILSTHRYLYFMIRIMHIIAFVNKLYFMLQNVVWSRVKVILTLLSKFSTTDYRHRDQISWNGCTMYSKMVWYNGALCWKQSVRYGDPLVHSHLLFLYYRSKIHAHLSISP